MIKRLLLPFLVCMGLAVAAVAPTLAHADDPAAVVNDAAPSASAPTTMPASVPVAAPTSSATSAPAPVVPATTIPDADKAPWDAARWVWDQVMAKNWWPVAAGVLVIVVWVLRRFVFAKIDWFATDRGGACLALGTSMLLAIANAIAAGRALNAHAILVAAGVGFAAGGGWSMVKKILGLSSAPAAS